jgi:hypothetical protein
MALTDLPIPTRTINIVDLEDKINSAATKKELIAEIYARDAAIAALAARVAALEAQ